METSSVLDFLASYGRLDRLTTLGGEPLLHSGIESILAAIRDADIGNKRLTTNLTSIERLDITTVKSGAIRICASLDGHLASIHDKIRGKGMFSKTVSNIRSLISDGVDIEIVHTVTSASISYIFNLIEFCRTMGIRRLNLHKISPRGNAINNNELQVSPTEWIGMIDELIRNQRRQNQDSILLRYEQLFATREEYRRLLSTNSYHNHAEKSYYSSDEHGHRIVLYADGKLHISSEAFGTQAHIGTIINGVFSYNKSNMNELELLGRIKTNESLITIINPIISGDSKFPIVLSVSYRNQVYI